MNKIKTTAQDRSNWIGLPMKPEDVKYLQVIANIDDKACLSLADESSTFSMVLDYLFRIYSVDNNKEPIGSQTKEEIYELYPACIFVDTGDTGLFWSLPADLSPIVRLFSDFIKHHRLENIEFNATVLHYHGLSAMLYIKDLADLCGINPHKQEKQVQRWREAVGFKPWVTHKRRISPERKQKLKYDLENLGLFEALPQH